MTGVSWRPPPPPRTGWLGQRCAGRSLGGLPAGRWEGAGRGAGGGGGVPAERWGGGGGRALGGRRRPVKVTDSWERRPGEPSSGRGRRRWANDSFPTPMTPKFSIQHPLLLVNFKCYSLGPRITYSAFSNGSALTV